MLISSSSLPSFRNDRKKNQRERERKGRFQKGSFPTKKKKNCRKKRPINMPSEGKLEGENARKHTLLSIIKTPNNTSSLHQMSGFFACARAVLYFFSCALYFETAALLCSTMTTTTMGGERKPCLPFKERIFLPHQRMLFFFFFAFVQVSSSRYFRRYFSTTKESKKTLLRFPFPFVLGPSLFKESSRASTTKIQKKREKELERENQNHFFSPQQPHKYSFSLFFCA